MLVVVKQQPWTLGKVVNYWSVSNGIWLGKRRLVRTVGPANPLVDWSAFVWPIA